MNKLEYIKDKNGNMLSIIIRSGYEVKKSHFINSEKDLQNVGFFRYAKNHIVKPHYHPEVERTIYGTPEVVVLKKGKVKLIIYDNNQEFIGEYVINKGDIFLLISGGHSEEMLEDTDVFVVKQGPYIEENDKIPFRSNK